MPEQETQSLRGENAGFVSRLVAFVIDIVIVSVAVFVITGLGTLILHFFNLDTVLAEPTPTDTNFIKIFRIIYNVILIIIYLLLIIAYHPFFWMLAEGRTPGKYLMGIQVVTQRGQRLRLGQCLKRFAGYWLSALVLFLGYLSVLIDDDRRSWHDKLAKTSVTYVWEARYNQKVGKRVQERRALRSKDGDSQQ
jgi:uncharacterized RDD family membrane protein YckC